MSVLTVWLAQDICLIGVAQAQAILDGVRVHRELD